MSQFKAKISPLSLEDAKLRAEEIGLHSAFAELNVFRVLLHHPELASVISKQLIMLLYKGELDERLRELIIMRIGWATAADYEWSQHWPIALASNCSEADLVGLKNWQAYDSFNPQDQSVLQAVDDVLSLGMISSTTFASFSELGFSDAVKLEIIAAINNWRGFSQLLKTLELPVEEGVISWPPHGVAPV